MARRWLPLCVPALLALIAFRRFVGVWWFADDYFYLFAAANGDPARAILLAAPGHFPVTWNAIRLLAFEAAGPNPLPLALFLVALHALNSFLVAALVERYADRAAGLVAGGLFAVSASHGGTLGWIAAGGHVPTATATLALLLALPTAPVWVLIALALVMATSFGSGPALLLAMPFVVLLFAPRRGLRVAAPLGFVGAVFAVAALFAQGGDHSIVRPQIAAAIAFRPQRDTTAALGLLWQLRGAALTTLPVFPLVGVAILSALLCAPRAMLAMMLLATTALAAVAVGRAPFAQYGYAAELVANSLRYYYAPQAFLAVAAGCGLRALPGRVRQWLAVAAGLAFAALALWRPVDPPPSEELAVARALAALASVDPGSTVRNRRFVPVESIQALFAPRALFPGLAGASVVFGGAPDVRFRARDEEEYDALRRGGEIARILLPPPRSPAHGDGARERGPRSAVLPTPRPAP